MSGVETEWRFFDEERGLEVKYETAKYHVRDRVGTVWVLTAEQFDKLRSDGPGPPNMPQDV